MLRQNLCSPKKSFAPDTVIIPVEVLAVARIAAALRRRACGTRCGAVGECPRLASKPQWPIGRRYRASWRAMTMSPAIFAVVVAAVGRKSARMSGRNGRRGQCGQCCSD